MPTPLRKSIAEFLTSKALSNTGDVKSDVFQTFVRQNRAALAQVFKPDELKSVEAVAAELSRFNRVAKQAALPGRSTTAQDLLSQPPHAPGKQSLFMEALLAGSAGLMGGGLKGAAAGTGVAVGRHLFSAARAAGMHNVSDLMRRMLLHPDLAKAALEKASTRPHLSAVEQAKSIGSNFLTQLGRVATMNAGRQVNVLTEGAH